MEQVDILTIAAHPDDVELTCSGTLIRMVAQGYSVGMLDLTEGEMGTRGTPQIRAAEAEAAEEMMEVAGHLLAGVMAETAVTAAPQQGSASQSAWQAAKSIPGRRISPFQDSCR